MPVDVTSPTCAPGDMLRRGRRDADRRAGGCRRNHRHREGSGRRSRCRGRRHRHEPRQERPASSCRAVTASTPRPAWRRGSTDSTSSCRVSSQCDATAFASPPAEGADRLRSGRRRRARTGHVTADAPIAPRGDRQPGDRRRTRADRAAAAERPRVHHARVAGPRRRPAAEFSAAPHQRRPAAHERIPVRRHLRASAGARPGGVLPRHRRDPGIQDREQQPPAEFGRFNGGVDQSDDQGGHQRRSTATDSSSSATRRSTPGISFSRPTR